MSNPQVDAVYKSYIAAYQAAARLRKQNANADVMVRIEDAPYEDGYVVRAIPIVAGIFPVPVLGIGLEEDLGDFHPRMRNAKYGRDKKALL